MGTRYAVPPGITLVQAMWRTGHEIVRGIGCLGGVCGACATTYRLPGEHDLKLGLACQMLVTEGISFSFAQSFPPKIPGYDFKDVTDPRQEIFRHYPEVALCRNCNACTEACPQQIDVRTAVWKAAFGDFAAVADHFLPCVMCGLCVPVCIADISSNLVGLYARRAQAIFFEKKPEGLNRRIAEIGEGKYDREWGNAFSQLSLEKPGK